MGKKIRVWDGTAWQDVSPSLPYTAIHSAQASMPATGVDGQVWLDTDGTLAGQDFVPLSGGTMTGNLNTPSINSGPIVGRNKIINGDFSIWQRGTTFTGSQYTADRWVLSANNTVTVSRQSFNPGSAPVAGYEGTHFAKINRTAVTTAYDDYFIHRIEDVRTFAGQTVTLSFWAKASTPVTVAAYMEQWFGSGGSSSPLYIGGTSPTVTTSWQRFSAVISVPSITNKTIGTNSFLSVTFTSPVANGNISYDIWGVQLEAGSQATPFHTATPNQQTELAACQRYYYRTTSTGAFAGIGGNGFTYSTTQANVQVQLPVPMRTYPSSVDVSNIRYVDSANGAANITQVAMWQIPASVTNATVVDFQAIGTGFTSGRYVFLQTSAGSGYLGFSAEL
jgi:hypothetical protein